MELGNNAHMKKHLNWNALYDFLFLQQIYGPNYIHLSNY